MDLAKEESTQPPASGVEPELVDQLGFFLAKIRLIETK